MKELWTSLLFPRRCPVCGEITEPEGALICGDCLGRLSPVRSPFCKRCGKEILSEQAEFCGDCMRHPRSFASGVSLLNYNEAARTSLAAVKYKNRREYLDFYSQAIARRYGKWLASLRPDALVPVPVHASRRRRRGFNQAEELARRLSALTGIPCQSDILIRNRKTAPQKELNPAERLKNLQSAFGLSPHYREHPEDLPGVIVLVDDIYTTGSTMEACSRILLSAGADRVHILTVCIGKGV